MRSHALITRELSAQLSADHGLTINEYEAMLHLFRAEDHAMRRVDLAEELLLTPSGVTRLLEGLEKAGYVEKRACSGDARVTYAVLTASGKRKLARAGRTHVTQIEEAFAERLDRRDLATLVELLERLSGSGAADDSCEP